MKRCEHCHQNQKNLYKMDGFLQNGQRSAVYLCNDCSYQFIQGKEWFHSQNGLIKSAAQPIKVNEGKGAADHVGLGVWAGLVKFMNFLTVIGFFIAGCVIGGAAGDEAGGIIGGIVGLILSGIIVSFSMLFVEMSQKLSILINEVVDLRKNL